MYAASIWEQFYKIFYEIAPWVINNAMDHKACNPTSNKNPAQGLLGYTGT